MAVVAWSGVLMGIVDVTVGIIADMVVAVEVALEVVVAGTVKVIVVVLFEGESLKNPSMWVWIEKHRKEKLIFSRLFVQVLFISGFG